MDLTTPTPTRHKTYPPAATGIGAAHTLSAYPKRVLGNTSPCSAKQAGKPQWQGWGKTRVWVQVAASGSLLSF